MKIAVSMHKALPATRFVLLNVAVLILLATGSMVAQVSAPLTIQESIYPGVSGIARSSEPVTVGLPLAQGQVACGGANPAACTGVSSMGITGATMGQFRCMIEWPDQSCKWMLVDTQATLTAGGASTSYTVTKAGTGNFGGFGGNMAADSNAANANSGTITVTTGAATFVIRKANQNGIDSAVAGTTTLVASNTSTGYVVVGPAAPGTSCGTCTTVFSSNNDAASTAVIEENGPVRAVVKETGDFKDSAGNVYMHYTARIYFYFNKSYVRVAFQLRNADLGGSNTFASATKGYRNLEMRLTPAIAGAGFSFGNDTATPTTGAFSGSQDAYLWMGFTSHFAGQYNSSAVALTNGQNGYQIIQGGTVIKSNTATTAAARSFGDLTDASGNGILAGHFMGQEFYPTSIQFMGSGSEVRVGMRADQALYSGGIIKPYYQAWPQHNIWNFYLQFHQGALADPQGAFLMRQHELVARSSVAYYNATNAWPGKMVSDAEYSSYWSAQGLTGVSDIAPAVTRLWSWEDTGGGNMLDRGYAYAQQFMERGFTGRYLWARNWVQFVAESAFPYSDGFDWRTQPTSSIDNFANPTAASANGNLATTNRITQSSGAVEHSHWWGATTWYLISGDETIHDFLSDAPVAFYGNTSTSLQLAQGLWNGRSIGNSLIAISRLYDIARGTNQTADANNYLAVADKLLNNQVWNDMANPVAGATGGDGTAYNRGFTYGCCYSITFPNPPAVNGPAGAGSTRASIPFFTSVIIQGLTELAQVRGTSWTSAAGTNMYQRATDFAGGMAHHILTEGFFDDGTCAATNTCGFLYEFSVDYPDSSGPATGQETIWGGFPVEHNYRGNLSFWQRKFNLQLRNLNAANGGGSWDENQIYMTSNALFYALHPGTVVPQYVIVSVTNNGGGSYTLSWTPPTGVVSYRLKHNPSKTIVDDLGWNRFTNTSTFDQNANQPFWSSPATRQQPAVGVSSITVTIDDLTGAALAATGESFSLKAYVSSGTLDTTPPAVSITAPANAATVSGAVTVSATAADNVGVVGVQFQLDGLNLGAEDVASPYSITWNTTTATPGAHTLTAVARDAAGNTALSSVTVTVSNPDTTPPTISITAPAAAATVSGSITVSANASDNVGVVGVQFQLDGANLGAEDTATPYNITWDTTKAANGTHTVGAIARDAAGNKTTATVSVTVANSLTPPGSAAGVGVDVNTKYSVELKELAPLVSCASCWFSTANDVMPGQALEIRVRPGTNPQVADQVILKQGAVDGTVSSVGTNQFVITPPTGNLWPTTLTVITSSTVTQFQGFASASGPVQAGQKVSVRGLLFKSTPSGVQLIAGTVELRQ